MGEISNTKYGGGKVSGAPYLRDGSRLTGESPVAVLRLLLLTLDRLYVPLGSGLSGGDESAAAPARTSSTFEGA